MQDQTFTITIGVLVQFNDQPPHVAAAIGKRQFCDALHCQGHSPTHIQFNPAETPPEARLSGLRVQPHRDVRPHHCRVCCFCQEEEQ